MPGEMLDMGVVSDLGWGLRALRNKSKKMRQVTKSLPATGDVDSLTGIAHDKGPVRHAERQHRTVV